MDEPIIIIIANSVKLIAFLKKHKDDKDIFDDADEFVFQRYEQKSNTKKDK